MKIDSAMVDAVLMAMERIRAAETLALSLRRMAAAYDIGLVEAEVALGVLIARLLHILLEETPDMAEMVNTALERSGSPWRVIGGVQP